jgi:Colicin V production protein
MGLDIALGIMVFLGALRGWFRGFMLQAIRLSGLVGCVYAAGPIRDYARPYVVPYLASVPPAMLDRMLWWSSAVVSYLTMVGLATLAVKLYRRRPYGEPEPNRADQFAGMLLAAGKSAVIAAFLIGALDKYALTWIKQVPWATELTKASTVLTWHERYHPSDKIWEAAPVQHFVGYVQKMGVAGPSGTTTDAPSATEPPPVQTASRPPRLDLPPHPPLDPNSPDFAKEFDEEFRKLDRP